MSAQERRVDEDMHGTRAASFLKAEINNTSSCRTLVSALKPPTTVVTEMPDWNHYLTDRWTQQEFEDKITTHG